MARATLQSGAARRRRSRGGEVLVAGLFAAATVLLVASQHAFLPLGAGQPHAEAAEAISGRRAALAATAAASAAVGGFAPREARAAIPMMEDFYIGAGSKIRPSEEEMEQMQKDYETSWKVALESSVSDAAKQVLEELKGADELLKNGDSDGVRGLLTRPVVLTMGLKIAPNPKRPVDGPWAKCEKQGGACGEALADARRSLQEVEEWCFSNRVEFYNSADQKQVMAKGDGKGLANALAKIKENTDEPLEALNNGRDALRQIIAKA